MMRGIAIVAVVAAFLGGIAYEQATFEPQIIEIPKIHIVEKPVTQIEKVYLPFEVVTTHEVIIEKPIEVKEFANVGELMQWVEEHSKPVIIKGNNVTYVLKAEANTDNDCDDFAESLQRQALEGGYLMSMQLVEDGELFGVPVTDSIGNHIGLLTIIGNDIYYIDSIAPYKITLITTRD